MTADSAQATAAGPAEIPALPPRPLRARPPVARFAQVFSVLLWLFGIGMVGFAATSMGPDLWADWQVRDNAQAVRGGNLIKGRCSSKLILHWCDTTLSAPNPNGGPRLRRETSFAFGSFSLGNFEAMVVADPRRPELLTTDLALDHFWDRVLTFLLLIGGLGALFIFALVKQFQGRREMALWRTSPCTPAPLRLQSVAKARGSATWTVAGSNGAVAQWTVPGRSKPFQLGDGTILGLRRMEDGAVMPLDAGLRWVALSDAERTAALASVSNPAGAAA